MGWNDHVSFVETECRDCGVTSQWEYWDDTAKTRYGGHLGEMLGHDANNSGRCPHCGSVNGTMTEEPMPTLDDLAAFYGIERK